ncbi:MAG TPA: penicillin-binding protein 2 [Geminicoccaceae bacterium]|nr:penicillin-binding protein 2 [Geminicoccaceae bacterium]
MQFMVAPPSGPVDPRVMAGRRRLLAVALLFTLAFAGVAARLVDLAVTGATRTLSAHATARSGPDTRRADITDRNGELLATNLLVPSVFADPAQIPNLEQAAAALARILSGVDAASLERKLRAAKRFAWVKHQVTPLEQAAVLNLGIPGVGFRFSEQRVYPKQHLASHVVGFVDIDNHGLAGVEHSFNEQLVGGRSAGKEPLALSLDLRVQQVVRDELLRAFTRFRAQGAAGVVLDRVTGELLALVSLPDYDPNRIDKATTESRKNRVTGNTYELGSLFKIFTAAQALDSGQVSLQDSFDATAPLRIGRHTIRDDHAKRRWLSMPEVFMYSSNIGTARMAFAAGGAEHQREFLERLGLLSRPVLELPELAKPQLPRRWAEITTATVAFGHGLAVTPLSFVDAVASVVGDGLRAPPTLLRHAPGAPVERTRVVSARTAEEMQWLMWLTVQKGTGTQAQVPGYLVGGKTGTADKVNPNGGGYLRNSVIASFVGVFPIDQPRYVVLVMLDDPRGDAAVHNFRYGGWTAAPVVREIIARIGPILNVAPARGGADAPLEDRLVVSEKINARTQQKERRFVAADAAR